MTVARSRSMLEQLEAEARERGLLLRLQVGRPLGLWSLRLVVARQASSGSLLLLGEMKGWAYPSATGLQLDTMRVMPKAPAGVGDLIWAATMAWAQEATPCSRARLLAIRDDEQQHRLLVRYFRKRGFSKTRDVEAALWDLPLRRRIAWPPRGIRPWRCRCLPARLLIWSWPINRPIWPKGGAIRTPQPPIRSLAMLLRPWPGCGPDTRTLPSMWWASASGGMPHFWRPRCPEWRRPLISMVRASAECGREVVNPLWPCCLRFRHALPVFSARLIP